MRTGRDRLVLVGSCLIGAWLPWVTGCGGWHGSLERGVEEAQRTGKRVLVQFYEFNEACRQMDDEVFSDEEVRKLMDQRYVPVRLDGWMHRERAEQYGVVQYPTFLIFRRDGTLAGSRVGAMNAESFRAFLIKHAYN